MTFEEIILTAYATQFAQHLFGLADYNDGNGTVISFWNVPNVTQPTNAEIMALDTAELEQQFYFNNVVAGFVPQLTAFVDSVARQRQYNDAVSCASYITSSVANWKSEATSFIAWRDSVYNYSIAQQALMIDGSRTVPTFAEFQTELPTITWPD